MARYIDADSLYRRVKTHTNPYGKPTLDYESGVKVLRMIEQEPTADVVPKSEEGAECPTCYGTGRIGTTNWLTKNISKKQLAEEKAKAIAEHEQYIKTEVAREIFEEIKEIGSFGEPIVDYICMSFDELAELKKKYTEGE